MTPRLLAVACTVVLCWAFSVGRVRAQAFGDPSAFIDWSADRPLTIKDFKARIPARATEASMSWVAIEASWECEGGKASSRVRAVFDPGRSWWREKNQNLWQRSDDPSLAPRDDGGHNLLAHEQLHFNLTELWARKIRGLLAALPDACRASGGSQVFESTIAEMQRDWEDEQKRYDRETSHGMDAGRQKAWADRAAKALKEPERRNEGQQGATKVAPYMTQRGATKVAPYMTQ